MPRKNHNRKKRYRKKKKQEISTKGDKEVTKTGQIKRQSVIYRGIGIPAEFYTKLKYSDTLDFSGAPYRERILRMNSLYDPLYMLGGDQPMYYDEFSLLYARYCVQACDVQVTFINRSATGETSYQRVGCYPLGVPSTSASIYESVERDNCVYSTLGPNTGDQGIVSMSIYGKIHKLLGLPSDEKNDDTLSAVTSTDPANIAYLHVFGGSLDTLTDSSFYATITMTFYCKFFDRINVARS